VRERERKKKIVENFVRDTKNQEKEIEIEKVWKNSEES